MPRHEAFGYAIAKRTLDTFIATVGTVASLPVLLYAGVQQSLDGKLIEQVELAGRNGRGFRSYTSSSPLVRRAFRLWDVLRGHVSLVGPRLAGRYELPEESQRVRQVVTPGIVGLHWLRQRTNIAYAPEAASDAEYIRSRSLKLDISILLRSLLALLYGKPATTTAPTVEMLGVNIDNTTLSGALDAIEGAIERESFGGQVAFVNADCLNKAANDAVYAKTLNDAWLVLADGIGVKMAGAMLSRPVRENVNGTDLFPQLCDRLNRRRARLFLLGARPEVVESLTERVQREYPEITVCGAQHGYFTEEDAVVRTIASASPDVLLVALGAPQQEMFIARNRERLGAKVSIGVGGLFDFYSGRIPRAPQWMREAGLEWTYRLYQEPRRMWRRYLLGNVEFLVRVLLEKRGSALGARGKEVLP